MYFWEIKDVTEIIKNIEMNRILVNKKIVEMTGVSSINVRYEFIAKLRFVESITLEKNNAIRTLLLNIISISNVLSRCKLVSSYYPIFDDMLG